MKKRLLIIVALVLCASLFAVPAVKDHFLSKRIVGTWVSSGSVDGMFKDIEITFRKDHSLITESQATLHDTTNIPIAFVGEWRIEKGVLFRLMSSDWKTKEFENRIIEVTPEKLVIAQDVGPGVLHKSR
jgi:hypothetical protein